MQVPLEITFQNMDPSDAVEVKIRERVDKLERFSDRITRCGVSVEAPHRAHRHGNLYHIRVEISVPGKDLVVSKDPGDLGGHTDVYVAIRDSFAAAERQVAEHARLARHEVKSHEPPLVE